MKTLADLTAPAPVERKLLEKDVQGQCVDWAQARGYWARKFSSMTQRSVPDYLFARKAEDSVPGFMRRRDVKFGTEFKKPGTKPKPIPKYGVTVMSTQAQYEEQLAMQAAGWITFECDDFEAFKAKVYEIERAATG